MDSFLLATKLRIPPQPHYAVSRARLIDILERGVLDYKLILLSAPAGYGKTTLLAQWSYSCRPLVAWLAISEDDNDLDRFLRYLVTAWLNVQPEIEASALGILLSAMSPDTNTLLSAFINVAADVDEHVVFVLDDYHLIAEPSIHHTITFLLDHLPPKLHFVLAGRGEPPLPLARYRARHQLLELRSEELRFTQEETADFLNQSMRLDLPPEEVVRLQAQLEGWVAGLQLAGLSLQRRLAGANKLVVGGNHRFIADFLDEDVLAPLSADLRQFLLQTSILDRLCGPLCDAVTGRENSQEALETVERADLFLLPLDEIRQWYRYHGLFADFLHEQLKRSQPEKVGELHRRAASWYLDHELPEQAFRHALAGDHVELVIQILERYLIVKIFGGEFRVSLQWLAALPDAWYRDHPRLNLYRATALVATGELDAGARCLEAIEALLVRATDEESRVQMARAKAVRCFIACFRNDLPAAEEYAAQALRDLPNAEIAFRADIYQALGDTYRRNRRWQAAMESYLTVLDFDQPAFTFRPAHVYGALADLAFMQGRLHDAAARWQRALANMQQQQNWGRLPMPLIGWVYIRMGELFYEWNDLATAWDHLERGLTRAELGGDIRSQLAGYLLASRVKLAENDLEAAASYLDEARPLVSKSHLPEWRGRFERLQLDLWLEQDRQDEALTWAARKFASSQVDELAEHDVSRLVIARVLTLQGDRASLEQAAGQLERLCAEAQHEGRTGVYIEALALQALLFWRFGEQAEAMLALGRALQMAAPEGFVRLFTDLGLPMLHLLQEAHARAMMPEYVATLLAASGANFAVSSPDSDHDSMTPPEKLTPREREVLTLVAAGLTRQEIADKLVVSAETIKKHTSNIYGKLGAHNRTQAVAKARELDILG